MASDLLMLRIFTVSVQNNCTKFVNNTEEKYSLPPSLTKILILPVLWLLLLLIKVINKGVSKVVPIGRQSPDDHDHNQNEEQEVPETLTKPHLLPVLQVEGEGREEEREGERKEGGNGHSK